MTLVSAPKRSSWQIGDPIRSRKLRVPTLAWIGINKTNSAAAKELGIPIAHFSDWISNDARALDDTYQEILMAHPGIQEKYKMLERRGIL